MRRSRHLTGFGYVGCYRYHTVLCTHERVPVFTRNDVVDVTRGCLVRAVEDQQFAVLAFCFMPDHLHLLIQGTAEDADFLRLLSQFKQRSGFAHLRMFRERLRQRYSYEHVLRDEEASLATARYIVANPLRAGLVQQIADYPHPPCECRKRRHFRFKFLNSPIPNPKTQNSSNPSIFEFVPCAPEPEL